MVGWAVYCKIHGGASGTVGEWVGFVGWDYIIVKW